MFIEECDSTNTLLRRMANGRSGSGAEKASNGEDYLYTGYQTAGRGQTGNGWESERGKNLLCSILIKAKGEWRMANGASGHSDKSLFDVNIAVGVAVLRTIRELGISELAIKWPNDIYWGDKKIAGILLENAIVGNKIKYSIAGIGLNVNQTVFVSDAPNPVSLKQITGQEYNIHALMKRLYEEVQKALGEDVWDEYKAHLYRREGFWPFVEREVDVTPTMNAGQEANGQFLARIEDILPSGELVLRDKDNKKRIYHFKQIRYVI